MLQGLSPSLTAPPDWFNQYKHRGNRWSLHLVFERMNPKSKSMPDVLQRNACVTRIKFSVKKNIKRPVFFTKELKWLKIGTHQVLRSCPSFLNLFSWSLNPVMSNLLITLTCLIYRHLATEGSPPCSTFISDNKALNKLHKHLYKRTIAFSVHLI